MRAEMARTQALIIHYLVRGRMLIRTVPFQLPVLVLRARRVDNSRNWARSTAVTLVVLANLVGRGRGWVTISHRRPLQVIDPSGCILSVNIVATDKGDSCDIFRNEEINGL